MVFLKLHNNIDIHDNIDDMVWDIAKKFQHPKKYYWVNKTGWHTRVRRNRSSWLGY
jgi:hypothetical protein